MRAEDEGKFLGECRVRKAAARHEEVERRCSGDVVIAMKTRMRE